VQADLLTACLVLMWASAVFSAAIDNIPFTAAMIPIIVGAETQGVNVTPLWWALAVGVGKGGNGTHPRVDRQRVHRDDFRAFGQGDGQSGIPDNPGTVVQEKVHRS
jgi:hypothetical protein